MSSYSERIKRLKMIQAALIVVLIVMVIGYVYYVNRPAITVYERDDQCGPIGGIVSHEIDNADSCANACTATCLSRDTEFHDSAFELRDPECNDCTCYCAG